MLQRRLDAPCRVFFGVHQVLGCGVTSVDFGLVPVKDVVIGLLPLNAFGLITSHVLRLCHMRSKLRKRKSKAECLLFSFFIKIEPCISCLIIRLERIKDALVIAASGNSGSSLAALEGEFIGLLARAHC